MNDNFAGRQPLAGPGPILVGDLTRATREPGEPLHAGTPDSRSLWWTWTAPSDGVWSIQTPDGKPPGAGIGVFMGTTLATLATVATNRNGTAVSFPTRSGDVFQIAVASLFNGVEKIQLVIEPVDVPTNNVQAVARFVDYRLQADGFWLRMTGPTGATYHLEVSEDLIDGIELRTGIFGAEPLEYFDPAARSSYRYYRLRLAL